MPVAKKDGSIRLCVDFRKVNKVTVPDPYYIPLVGEIVDRVAGAQYLSKLDLNKGFHQVPLSEEAKQRAAIVTPFGKFQFTMMQSCQGLRISMCEIFESAISSPHQHYCGRKNTISNLTEPYIATIISSCLQRLL